MISNLVSKRLSLGKEKYGHGVRARMNTKAWCDENSWMEMAEEEFGDALVYVAADYIRKHEESKEPDDNERILELILNPRAMSGEHAKIMETLTELITLSREAR
tara:strand:- start:366 stop:677 length:312 start_codon:yes stop_codon:yes gene_type:complete